MGKQYHFRNNGSFNRLVNKGKVIKARIKGQKLGVPVESFDEDYHYVDPNSELKYSGKATVRGLDAVFQSGKIIILDSELSLIKSLKKKYGEEPMSIFISPFSMPIIHKLHRPIKTEKTPPAAYRASRC